MQSTFVNRFHQASNDDYYVILDLDYNASPEAVISAYRNLARKFHPDKNNQDERSRKEAEVIFERIKTAYDVLSDPRKRQIYDTLGPEGLKIDGWMLERKQMTAQEIRDEFMRIQRLQIDNQMALTAKPRASFTMAIDATDLFSKRDKGDLMETSDDSYAIDLPNIEISSMSASMAVDQYVSSKHSLTLSGNLNAKNGTGDGSFDTKYLYKYSPTTQFDVLYQIGRGPVLTAGVNHHLSDKTTLSCRGFIILNPYFIAPGVKITLTQKIRNYLTGQVSYRDGFNSSVKTSLIYYNEKLMLEVTTSYKISHLNHRTSVDFGYRFNDGLSKLSVTLAACSNEGLAVEYGCETRVLEMNFIGAAVSFALPAGVSLKFRYNRANQEFNIPIHLSDEVHSAPLFYGTMVPLIAYYLLDRCYLRHYKKSR